jgi:Fibronectin type III domain
MYGITPSPGPIWLASKQPDAQRNWTIDATRQLAGDNDALISVTVTTAPARADDLAATNLTVTPLGLITVTLNGGQPGTFYSLHAVASTASGRVLSFSANLEVLAPFTEAGQTAPPSPVTSPGPLTWSYTPMTANGAAGSLPTYTVLHTITLQNMTSNPIVGGINIGTTAGAAYVAAAVQIAANARVVLTPPALLAQFFSAVAPQALYISAIGSWNGAALAVGFKYEFTAAGSAFAISSLPMVTSLAETDVIAISSGGTNSAITYQNFVDGETIDEATAAGPASDSDEFWVGQGSSTMAAQTFAAVWAWIQTKLPTYRRVVVEIAVNTTLDGSVHNGAILVCSQPITLTPAFVNMGSGFTCTVVNVSAGNVTFATGITTSSGTQTLATGQSADLRAFTYSGGNIVFAQIGGGGAPAIPPGQVTGLAVGAVTPTSVALTWQVPSTGGEASGYTVNFRVTSVGGAWTAESTSSTSLTVTGLAAATQYDFEVIANNAAGSGTASSIVTGTTLAAPTQPPGQSPG